MARQSADKVAASLEPQGRDDLWPVIRDTARDGVPGAWFTVADLFRETCMARRTISSYLSCLVAARMVERQEPEASGGAISYRLLRDTGVHAPRLRRDGTPVVMGSGNDNLWRSMRMQKDGFTPLDLAVLSTNELITVSEEAAKSYCKHLLAAGYLKVVKQARPGHSQAVYRLIKNTGPKPPQIQRVKRVFDPNTNTAHVSEVAA